MQLIWDVENVSKKQKKGSLTVVYPEIEIRCENWTHFAHKDVRVYLDNRKRNALISTCIVIKSCGQIRIDNQR